jgi:hypothetical protein
MLVISFASFIVDAYRATLIRDVQTAVDTKNHLTCRLISAENFGKVLQKCALAHADPAAPS